MTSTVVTVAVAYGIMIAILPVPRASAYLIGAVLALAVLSGDRAGLWWTDRGWALLVAGWFVALTLLRPETGFLPRALGSVGGAAAIAGTLVAVRAGSWDVLDWQMGERIRAAFGQLVQTMHSLQDTGRLQGGIEAVDAATYGAADYVLEVFPAAAALASLAALGIAWWLYVKWAHGDDQGLLPLREFRFNDHLVWLLVAGIALVLIGGDGAERVGSNAVVFMSALYALRGAAVVAFFGGGQSLLGAVLLFVVLMFVWPLMVVGALLIGLGDTWLDLRARARAMTA